MATFQENTYGELMIRVNAHVESLLKKGEKIKFQNVFPQETYWVAIVVREI